MRYLKKGTINLLLFLYVATLNSQIKISGNLSVPPSEYSAFKIDDSNRNFYYKYSYVPNLKNKSKVKSSTTILQVGANFSKFTDVFVLKRDSLKQSYSKQERIGAKEFNLSFAMRAKIGFEKNVFKDLKKNIFTIQGQVYKNEYKYNINATHVKWKLKKTKKDILGYTVNKAELSYGGRNWIAWYTQDIPVPLGPHVFGGLPGLIMEIYDEKNMFHFTIIGMDTKVKEIYMRNEQRIKEVSRKEFMNDEKNFHERPDLYFSGTIKGGGTLKKKPYNPIELLED